MGDRRRDDDEERGSRRSRDDDREERGSKRSRDDDDRGSRSRDREEDRSSSRERDDDRGGRRSRDDDEGSSRSSSSYRYERRDADTTRNRASKGNTDYDRFLSDRVKVWKPNDGDNRIRILPPTWTKPKPEHFGLDIYVHYGIGADRQTYLCPKKMLDKPCPICEARDEVRKELNDDEGNKELEKAAKDLEPKRRVLVYLLDRDHERDGLQAYASPWTLDRDIVQVMQDKRTGEVLPIDDPEDGYDVEFVKKGTKDRTEYPGVAIARRSSPLGNEKAMQFAVDNPLSEQLVYFEYDHIAKAFGGRGSMKRRDDDAGDRGGRSSGRDRDEPARGRDRDAEAPRRSRDDDDRGSRSRPSEEAYDWDKVHDMTKSELEDLIDEKDLDIKPKDAKDVEDLADWVCEEMKIKKPEKKKERVRDSDGEGDDKLAEMRRRRERD